MDVLNRIKSLIVRGKYRFTLKASNEVEMDGLDEVDVLESILNARTIRKTLRTTSAASSRAGEKLYVIESPNFKGTLIYSKGKIAREAGEEIYYIFISSKKSRSG